MRKQIVIFFLCVGIATALFNCTNSTTSPKGTVFIPASDSNFIYLGRIDYSNPISLHFVYSGVSVRFRFEGTTCIIHLKNKSTNKDNEGNYYKNYYNVVVDNGKPQVYTVSNEDENIKIKNLSKGTHEIIVFKRTEAFVGEGIFEGVSIEKGKTLIPVNEKKSRKIEFVGNSITCGYGNEGTSGNCSFSPETENAYAAYGAITARKLDADYNSVAYSGKGMYRNSDGKTTNTMSLIYDKIFPDSINSPKWDFKKSQPDMVVINLGTNDFYKGIPDSVIFVNTYVNFLKRLRSYYPSATFVCIESPYFNDSYLSEGRGTKMKNYINASKNKMKLIGDTKVYTFFSSPLEDGDYGCDMHPNLKRHEKMADELAKEIKKIMNW